MYHCFNRYMVECELACIQLILVFHAGFNRYMVECEFNSFYFCIFKAEVLIDTWWNVNEWYNVYKENYGFVLIDTWWNVN